SKQEPRWEGPYKVVRCTAGNSYSLMDHDGTLLSRKYAPSQLKLVSADVVKSVSFEIEKILDFKQRRGKPFYFVSLENLGPAEDSWEPYENFDDIRLIREFHQANPTLRGAPTFFW
ncbi:hypothetical protein BC829DRAFT_365080, partial [Chytridium lagenaria]